MSQSPHDGWTPQPQVQEQPPMSDNTWQDISTAPKSGWFLALRAAQSIGLTSCRVAVVHRVEGVGFGPWEGSEGAYYEANFFSHWMPLPQPPV